MPRPKRAYQEALGYIRDLKGITEETRANYTAGTYHQLGMVAQEQRQWAQAEQHYQQALAINIEFNDRYSQADTYHQLGMVAQAAAAVGAGGAALPAGAGHLHRVQRPLQPGQHLP